MKTLVMWIKLMKTSLKNWWASVISQHLSKLNKLNVIHRNGFMRVKCNSQEWFHGEVLESVVLQDKLFKKFKSSKLNVDKEIQNKACKIDKSHRLILKKKMRVLQKQN